MNRFCLFLAAILAIANRAEALTLGSGGGYGVTSEGYSQSVVELGHRSYRSDIFHPFMGESDSMIG